MTIDQITDSQLAEVAEAFGTPTYTYFSSMIDDRVKQLRDVFSSRFALSFAAKCNPNPAVLSLMSTRVEYLDVSSIGEFQTALKSGWDARRISFTGPAKREFEIRQALGSGLGELVIESPREAEIANAIAASIGIVQPVLVRIAPVTVPKGFGDHMAGRPSAFGIDWEDVGRDLPIILAMPNLRMVGIHIYSGTQCLKAAAICENFRNFLRIFRDVYASGIEPPDKLIFGSGFGIPYHDGDAPLDLQQIQADLDGDLATFISSPTFSKTRLVLELGRFLVGEAGFFLTRIVGVKHSRGVTIGMCDGGMNHHLPASGHFGMVMHRNYLMHKVGTTWDMNICGPKVNLTGPLCTSIDRLASGVSLPPIMQDDVIAIHSSGAYGLTASPIHFISHAPPREVLIDESGMRDVSTFEPLPVSSCTRLSPTP